MRGILGEIDPSGGDDRFHEACAVMAAFNVPDAATIVTRGLLAQNHRGQEGTGIVSHDGHAFYTHRDAGLVMEVFTPAVRACLLGDSALGHNRYATSGVSGGNHLQPFLENGGFAFAVNGNLPTTTKLEAFLADAGVTHIGLNDSEKMSRAISILRLGGLSLKDSVKAARPLFTGAYAGVVMDAETMVAFRDECGVRPLSLARKGAGWLVSSETCGFSPNDATFVRDVEPGEILEITRQGLQSEVITDVDPRLDIFELIYFAAPDSVMLGQSVYETRHNTGLRLGLEQPVNDADMVIPIPNSAIPAAQGYAEALGLPCVPALVRNPYVQRTFILPEAERVTAIRDKFRIVVSLVKGKRVVLVDDSVVRGNTTRGQAELLLAAGAQSVDVRVASPPIIHPHIYGVDIKTRGELLAVGRTPEQIAAILGVRSVGYVSIEGLVAATGHPASRFDLSPFNGDYSLPFPTGLPEYNAAHAGR